MSNVAQNVLVPENGTFRITHLYVGQGESTLLTIPDGDGFKYALIDCNIDKENGGIDIVKMLKDLTNDEIIFINTHPHNDHLKGIKDVYDEIGISEVWHSGHKPGNKHKDSYEELTCVIDKVGKENEYILFGTNSENKIRKSDKETEVDKKLGDIDFLVISPAEYVTEDIEGEEEEKRYKRIHEMCGVIKLMYGAYRKSILQTGDSDKKAWTDHITEYHKDNLSSEVLSASHHGSRTFFKENESDEDVYEDHIESIAPEYLVISAPKQSESPHDHPHDDAMELYKKYVQDDNIFHLGKDRVSLIVDITSNGDITVKTDKELVNHYGFSEENEANNEEDNAKNLAAAFSIASKGVSPRPYLSR